MDESCDRPLGSRFASGPETKSLLSRALISVVALRLVEERPEQPALGRRRIRSTATCMQQAEGDQVCHRALSRPSRSRPDQDDEAVVHRLAPGARGATKTVHHYNRETSRESGPPLSLPLSISTDASVTKRGALHTHFSVIQAEVFIEVCRLRFSIRVREAMDEGLIVLAPAPAPGEPATGSSPTFSSSISSTPLAAAPSWRRAIDGFSGPSSMRYRATTARPRATSPRCLSRARGLGCGRTSSIRTPSG